MAGVSPSSRRFSGLLVDDDSGFLELTKSFLEKKNNRFDVEHFVLQKELYSV